MEKTKDELEVRVVTALGLQVGTFFFPKVDRKIILDLDKKSPHYSFFVVENGNS